MLWFVEGAVLEFIHCKGYVLFCMKIVLNQHISLVKKKLAVTQHKHTQVTLELVFLPFFCVLKAFVVLFIYSYFCMEFSSCVLQYSTRF